jgi:hypothetical protein
LEGTLAFGSLHWNVGPQQTEALNQTPILVKNPNRLSVIIH